MEKIEARIKINTLETFVKFFEGYESIKYDALVSVKDEIVKRIEEERDKPINFEEIF